MTGLNIDLWLQAERQEWRQIAQERIDLALIFVVKLGSTGET